MKVFFSMLLLLSVHLLVAQKSGPVLIDSIRQTLPGMKEDSNKVKSLAKISEIYLQLDPAKGIDFAKSGLSIAEQLHWKRGISRLNNLLGLMIGDTGNNTQARVYFEESYRVNQEIGYSFGMISNLNNIGRSYQRESQFSKALAYYFRALAIAEAIKDDGQIALVGTNLTASFVTQKNYAKGLEYADMTLKHGRLSHTPNNVGKALLQMGVIKAETKDTLQAKQYMNKALQVYEETGNKPAIAMVLVTKASLEYPDYEKAIEQMSQAQQILDSIGPSSISSIGNLSNLGNAYYTFSLQSNPVRKKVLLGKAESFLNRGIQLSKETVNAEFLANMYLTLSKINEERKEYQPALENFKSFYTINDSLFSQDKKNQLAGMESKYRIDLKDNEIALNKITLASQQKTLILLVLGLALLFITGGLLFWQNRIRKKTNMTLLALNSQLDEANQIKLKFFGILSHDLRSPISNLVNYLHLLKNAPDLLTAEEQQASQQQIGQSTGDLLQTLETTLLWSKEQMEQFKPDMRQVAVRALFDYLRIFFSHTGNTDVQCKDPADLEVFADENYLRVIMQNLTANALKAVANRPNGNIEWKAVEQSGQTILYITDNGPGLPKEQIKKLFTESNDFNSTTGFGFHLIRDLAKAIQYQISVESEPGRGTTFILSSA